MIFATHQRHCPWQCPTQQQQQQHLAGMPSSQHRPPELEFTCSAPCPIDHLLDHTLLTAPWPLANTTPFPSPPAPLHLFYCCSSSFVVFLILFCLNLAGTSSLLLGFQTPAALLYFLSGLTGLLLKLLAEFLSCSFVFPPNSTEIAA